MIKEKVIFLASLRMASPFKLAFDDAEDVKEDLKLKEIRETYLMNFNGIIHGEFE